MSPREGPPAQSFTAPGIVLLLALAGCSGSPSAGLLPTVSPDTSDCNLPFTTVLQVTSGGQTPRLDVVRTQDDWCALWAEIYSGSSNRPACDTGGIDFLSQAALVTAGTGNSSCSRIDITCVHRDPDDNLTVRYRESSVTPPGVMCMDVMVSPMHAVSVDLPVGLVTFVKDTTTP